MEDKRNNDGTMAKWYHDVTLEDAETYISQNLQSAVRSVIAVGYYLKCIRDQKLYLEAGYETIWEYAQARYGFSKSTASRYMSRNDRFSVGGNSPVLASEYREYSKAQLQEMLALDAETMAEVTPEMSVREIRGLKKPAEKEIPYYEIPGQVEMGDMESIEESQETVAAPQQEHSANASAHRPEIVEESLAQTEEPDRGIVKSEADNRVEAEKSADMPENVNPQILEAKSEITVDPEGYYDERILAEMIQNVENTLEIMQEYWLESQPKTYKKHRMELEAYKMLAEQKKVAEEKIEPVQPELPVMRNNDQRKEWLRKYQDWGMWYEDEHTGLRYYKYDFACGARLIVEEYTGKWCDGEEYTSGLFHLVGGPKPPRNPSMGYDKWNRNERYNRYPNNETELIEFLKYIQKGEPA